MSRQPRTGDLEEQAPVMAEHVGELRSPPNIEAMAAYLDKNPSLAISLNQSDDPAQGIRISKRGVARRMQKTAAMALDRTRYTADTAVKMFELVAQWSFYIIFGYTTGRVVQYQDDIEQAAAAGTSYDCSCNTQCQFANRSSVSLEASSDDNFGIADAPTCQQSSVSTILPDKSTVYIAAGIFAFCKICQGLASFVASRHEALQKERLFIIYGQLTEVAAEYANIHLPRVELYDFDYPRAIEGIVGLVGIGAGNWLVSKDHIATGLLAVALGAIILSNATVGFVETQRTVTAGFLNYCSGILEFVSEGVDRLKTVKVQAQLEEVRKALTSDSVFR